MKLETAVKYMDADGSNLNPARLAMEVNSFSIDSRKVEAGQVFFAFSQPDYQNNCFNGKFADSHVFIRSAFEKGAIACTARPDRFEEHRAVLEEFRDRLIFVDDGILALQKLANGV